MFNEYDSMLNDSNICDNDVDDDVPTSTVITTVLQKKCTDEEKTIDEINKHSTKNVGNNENDDDDEEEISLTNGDQDNNMQDNTSIGIIHEDQPLSTATTPTTWKIMMPSWDTVENLTYSEQYEEARAYEDLCYITFSSEVIIN